MISCCSLVSRCVKWLGNDIAVYTCIPGAPQACPRIGDTHVSVSLKTATILSTVHRLFLRVQIAVVHSLQHPCCSSESWRCAIRHVYVCACVCAPLYVHVLLCTIHFGIPVVSVVSPYCWYVHISCVAYVYERQVFAT